MKNNLIICVSSRNNYDMLSGEVLQNINTNGYEFINVDDKSSGVEKTKGRNICNNHDIVFLENEVRGVQWAVQTIINFINENRPHCKWLFVFQHDCHPITPNFFTRISRLIDSSKLDGFGGMGFNVIDMGKYTFNALTEWRAGAKPKGLLGLSHLGISDNSRRWISPRHNPIAVYYPENWAQPFRIEIPMWAAAGINIQHWNNYVKPTEQYHFHLWYPDVAMQFNKVSKPIVILPDLYAINRQELKSKYNISENSAQGARSGNEYHFGEYSNFIAWKDRWGWDYERVKHSFPIEKYNDTMIGEYFNYDILKTTKPIESYDFGEY